MLSNRIGLATCVLLYGLGAMGEQGVTRALEIIHRELDATMALCGLNEVREAGPSILRPA